MNVEINGENVGTADEIMFQVKGDPWLTVVQEEDNENKSKTCSKKHKTSTRRH